MDVVVGWLQNDYGQLGRPAEAIAHALLDERLADRVAYVEPFRPAPAGTEPALDHKRVRGLDVWSGVGAPPVGAHEVAQAVLGHGGLTDPVLLNFGVAETNWWLHYEFAPLCRRTVLVTHDKLELWDRMAGRRPLLGRLRRHLIAASDVVCGLSEGSIDDVPGAHYVGHGVDAAWTQPGADAAPEPGDLAAIPHPRAIYVGALSVRFDVEGARALARDGIQVVLVGMDPTPEVAALAAGEPNVHFLGPRRPEDTPGYLRHCDLGIIPHTDEPFTYSMEPHKAYNYAAAGLRTVTLNTRHAPALGDFLTATATAADFSAAARRALERGRLGDEDVARARALTWGAVARRLLDHAAAGTAS